VTLTITIMLICLLVTIFCYIYEELTTGERDITENEEEEGDMELWPKDKNND